MIEDRARDDIAFIRRAIEEGAAYATACSPDMLIWGIAIAIGDLATYGFVRGWSPITPNAVWTICIALPWVYSLRRQFAGLAGRSRPPRGAMAQALGMLWLGCGVFLTTMGIAAAATEAIREGWFNAVVAGVMGIAFFCERRDDEPEVAAMGCPRLVWPYSRCAIGWRSCRYRLR